MFWMFFESTMTIMQHDCWTCAVTSSIGSRCAGGARHREFRLVDSRWAPQKVSSMSLRRPGQSLWNATLGHDVIQINSWACSSQDIFQQGNSSTREVDGHGVVMIVLCVYVILVTVPRLWIAHTARQGRRSNLTEILQVTVDLFLCNFYIYIYLLIDFTHRHSRFQVHCCPAMNTHFSAWTSQAKTVADIRYPFESGGLSVVLFVSFSQHEMKDLDGNHLLNSDVALCCFHQEFKIRLWTTHFATQILQVEVF